MIDVNDLRPGMVIEVDGDIWEVVSFQHTKLGRGMAYVKCKMKSLTKGTIVEKTFKGGGKVKRIITEEKEMQILYTDEDSIHLMDLETYEQISLPLKVAGDALKYVKEGDTVTVLMADGKPLQIRVPTFVELKVVDTPPGVKGDTASGGSKQATLETGLVITVPLFVNVGDIVKVDTRTNTYIERV